MQRAQRGAEQSRAQSRAEQSRAEQSRAEQSRAAQSSAERRAEQSRAAQAERRIGERAAPSATGAQAGIDVRPLLIRRRERSHGAPERGVTGQRAGERSHGAGERSHGAGERSHGAGEESQCLRSPPGNGKTLRHDLLRCRTVKNEMNSTFTVRVTHCSFCVITDNNCPFIVCLPPPNPTAMSHEPHSAPTQFSEVPFSRLHCLRKKAHLRLTDDRYSFAIRYSAVTETSTRRGALARRTPEHTLEISPSRRRGGRPTHPGARPGGRLTERVPFARQSY